MNTSPFPLLPVCAYDGRCYRKNPQHFQQFAHPKQYPSTTAAATTPPLAPVPQQLDDTPINVDGDDSDTPTLKRQQSEDSSNHTFSHAEDDGDTQRDPSSAPVLESDMASPALLLHFLSHPPHRATFLSSPDPVDALVDQDTAAPPRLDAAHNWNGVAPVLQEAYAGMGFHPADVQCVLTAARALKPSDPLSAFPDWRLVGPFELAVRYGDVCSSGGDGSALNAALRGILQGRNADEEVRRWRCGRFRYDPPECQCVAVQVSVAAPAAATSTSHRLTSTQLLDGGLHLCFHRDHPTDEPGMLVSGTARLPTFHLVNGEGALSAYLCAWYHAKDDAAAATVAQALEDALQTLSSGPDALSDSRRLSASFSKSLAEQKRGCATRSKEWVAATYSRLGICVPVDHKTDVGYREPNIPSNVSFAKCLRDAEADFVKSFSVIAGAPSSADPHAPGGTTTAAAAALVPFSRSANYDSLVDASVFTKKCSDCLDDIFLWADVANDEGDFGTSLELGLNAFSCIVADRCVATTAVAVGGLAADPSEQQQQRRGRRLEQTKLDPVLWHAFRLLDCAYMLLQRPLHRHILRCHLPLLASADNGVAFDV